MLAKGALTTTVTDLKTQASGFVAGGHFRLNTFTTVNIQSRFFFFFKWKALRATINHDGVSLGGGRLNFAVFIFFIAFFFSSFFAADLAHSKNVSLCEFYDRFTVGRAAVLRHTIKLIIFFFFFFFSSQWKEVRQISRINKQIHRHQVIIPAKKHQSHYPRGWPVLNQNYPRRIFIRAHCETRRSRPRRHLGNGDGALPIKVTAATRRSCLGCVREAKGFGVPPNCAMRATRSFLMLIHFSLNFLFRTQKSVVVFVSAETERLKRIY